jgi:hypothetical protein
MPASKDKTREAKVPAQGDNGGMGPRVQERVKRFYETELRGGRPIGRSSIGTCTKLTRSLNMDERHP